MIGAACVTSPVIARFAAKWGRRERYARIQLTWKWRPRHPLVPVLRS